MQNNELNSEAKLNLEGTSETELKKTRFSIPDGYFENLTPRMMESVRNSEKKVPERNYFWLRILVPSVGVAATLFLAWFLVKPEEVPALNFSQSLASMTIEELSEYADFQASELVLYELVDQPQLEFNEAGLSDQDILQYLNEDEIELTTLATEI